MEGAKFCAIYGTVLTTIGAAIIAFWSIFKKVRGPSPYGAIDYQDVGETRFTNMYGLLLILLGFVFQLLQFYIKPITVNRVFIYFTIAATIVIIMLYMLARKYYLPEYIAYLYSNGKAKTLKWFQENERIPNTSQIEEMGNDMNCIRLPGEEDDKYLIRIKAKVLVKQKKKT